MRPSLTIGSGSPSTMSYHQAGWPLGYSKAMKLCGSVAADLHQRGQAEQAVAGAVRRHQDAVQVGVLGDPLQLGDAADVARVGADDVDGVASRSGP